MTGTHAGGFCCRWGIGRALGTRARWRPGVVRGQASPERSTRGILDVCSNVCSNISSDSDARCATRRAAQGVEVLDAN